MLLYLIRIGFYVLNQYNEIIDVGINDNFSIKLQFITTLWGIVVTNLRQGLIKFSQTAFIQRRS